MLTDFEDLVSGQDDMDDMDDLDDLEDMEGITADLDGEGYADLEGGEDITTDVELMGIVEEATDYELIGLMEDSPELIGIALPRALRKIKTRLRLRRKLRRYPKSKRRRLYKAWKKYTRKRRLRKGLRALAFKFVPGARTALILRKIRERRKKKGKKIWRFN